MNSETIEPLFIGSKCSLFSLSDDIISSLSILKSLWQDEKIALAINGANTFFNQSMEIDCMGACKNCNSTVLAILKRLENVGLDQVFFNLLTERQRLKKQFKKMSLNNKKLKKKTSQTATRRM